MTTSTGRLVLRGGVLGDGSPADVAIDGPSGRITEVAPVIGYHPGDLVERCGGMVVLAAPAEPHAHLDKALSADSPHCQNPDGDLAGAIAVWHAHWAALHHHDLVERATRAVEGMVLRGTTAIRSHVDVGDSLGLRAVDALLQVKDDVERRGLADMQLVALVSAPVTGAAGAGVRRLLEAALDRGVDVVGGCPYRDQDPMGATALLLDVAEKYGVAVDLHTDETLDARVLTVAHLADMVGERGAGAGATASHCVSLGMASARRQAQIATALAEAGVSVVTLPQTNLYLQGRQRRTAVPRGLTALRPLLDAGVVVAGGADNVRDPFCAMGRLDATETAALLVMAGHLRVDEAWAACTTGARRAMGMAGGAVAPGEPAELLCIEGTDLASAVAGGSERRNTIHRGAVVARSEVLRSLVNRTPVNRTPDPIPFL